MAERRWVAAAAAFGALALQLTLPAHLVLPPRWLLPGVGLALLIGVVIANPDRCDRRSMGLRRASIALVAVMSLANAASAARLIDGLLSRMEIADARFLLRVGATIWVTNVVVFALWYWELDGGGPARRVHDREVRVDLLFPQHASPAYAPSGWRPQFVDYLYVSFTNAISLSPGETSPLGRWTKLTMMLQAGVSLGTLALVVARAVNVL